MSNTCEYCKGVFASKNILSQHQKKARYCLDIQLKINPETKIDNIPCQYCGKNFMRNRDKNMHESICKHNKSKDPLFAEYENKLKEKDTECEIKLKEKDTECEIKLKEKDTEYEKKLKEKDTEYEKKLKEKDAEINELKIKIINSKLESEISKKEIYKDLHDNSRNIIDKMATQPKNVSNNNILNNIPTLNINQEHLSQAADNGFTRELFLQGQAGVAQFFLGYMKDVNNGVVPFVVSDKSREILKYKDKNQEIVTDTKGNKLTQLAFNAVKTLNQKHYDSFYSSSSNINNSDDEEDEDTESDIKQELADKCFISIKKLPKDNTVFRKKIIEGCN
jgi:hypothetical protein